MIIPPSREARDAAAERLEALAIPVGAFGRLGDLAVWWSGVSGQVPPKAPANVRAAIFAGDHGITSRGVSAYPAEVTPAMVRAFHAGVAGVSVLARQHGVHVRVLDIAVDADLSDLGEDVVAHKIRRSSGAIDSEDAISAEEVQRALEVGRTVATEEIEAGADLLVAGDMGIGNTTVSAALIAAHLGADASAVTGRGTGVDNAALAVKTAMIDRSLERAGARARDPLERLAALGSADLAAQVGFLVSAASAGVPVLLDGVISVAAATVAADMEPGVKDWFAAGHRSPEPGQHLALESLGLEPLLDLGMRLGEGSGAVAAVPIVRSAALLLGETALLADVLG